MSTVGRDVRHGLRVLRRNLGFGTVGVLTLSVALGAVATVYGVVQGVLWEPLPYYQPGRLVDVSVVLAPIEGRPPGEGRLDAVNLRAWREATTTLEGLAAYRRHSFVLTGHGDPRRVEGATVSAALFPLLGAGPAMGRSFSEAEEVAGADRVVVLGHDLWRGTFQGRREVVGRVVRLDGEPHEIVGVMPEGFSFPDGEVELWKPLALGSAGMEGSASVHVDYFPVVGRLEEGVGIEAAEHEGQAVFDRMARSGDGAGSHQEPEARVRLTGFHDELVRQVRGPLQMLGASVALLLLIACVNVATLVLAHGASRQQELAVRMAVGGGRGRLLRQMVTESTILGGLGGLGGVVLAHWFEGLLRFNALDLPRIEAARLDAGVHVFVLVLGLAIGAVLGLVAGLTARTATPVAPARFRTNRSMGVFVVVEVALAVVLLVGAGILLRSYLHLLDVELGYEPKESLAVDLELEPGRHGRMGWSGAPLDELLTRLQGHPGVDAAGVISVPPFPRSFPLVSVEVEGLPPGRRLAVPQMTSAGYLHAAGMELAEGRWLTPEEHAGRAPVAVVNETFAARHLAGVSPLGTQVRVGTASLRIVGVVEDTRFLGLDSDPRPELFTGYHLAPEVLGTGVETLTLVTRVEGESTVVLEDLKTLLRELDPSVPVQDVRALTAQLSASVARPRFYTTALGVFAGIALVLACAGLYGVLSLSVASRTREIGVRASLGARGHQIVGMVLKQGVGLVAVGVALGAGAAVAVARLLRHLGEGNATGDPLPYSLAAGLLLTVGALASIVPAVRARAVDPADLLRRE